MQTDLVTELDHLERANLLGLEKAIAQEHRAVRALVGQLEHYGCPEAAQIVESALWPLTAAGMAVTLRARRT
jgi:hypothetical protein